MRCVRSGAPVKHSLEPQSESPQKTAVTRRELGNCPGLIPSHRSMFTHCCTYVICLINFYRCSEAKCSPLCKIWKYKPFLTIISSKLFSRREKIYSKHTCTHTQTHTEYSQSAALLWSQEAKTSITAGGCEFHLVFSSRLMKKLHCGFNKVHCLLMLQHVSSFTSLSL